MYILRSVTIAHDVCSVSIPT